MRVNTGRLARGFAWVVTGPLRYLIVLAWIAGTVAAMRYWPGVEGVGGKGAIGLLAPAHASAVQVEEQSLRLFPYPVLSRAAIVQRDPHGLSVAAQKRVVERAIAIDRHPGRDPSGIVAALPLINIPQLVPFAHERLTTAVTYLFFAPWRGIFDQTHLAMRYAQGHLRAPGDALIGVSGLVPARVAEGNAVAGALRPVEVGTVLLILLIVGFTFRALGAPLVTLFAAGVAYQVALHVLGYIARRSGMVIPIELEPLLVVLILAVCTDYAVFFLSGTRRGLQGGAARLGAARSATAEFVPIIVAAGLTIAGATACLAFGRLDFLQALGPALAVGVAMALVVAITLVPACLAIGGRAVFWPGLPVAEAETHLGRRVESWRTSLARGLATNLPFAFLTAVACVAALLVAATGLARMQLGLPLLSDLPTDASVAQATRAAGLGFTPGILSPTVIVVQQRGLIAHQAQLARLEGLIGQQQGVAGIVGPRERLRATAAYRSARSAWSRLPAQSGQDALLALAILEAQIGSTPNAPNSPGTTGTGPPVPTDATGEPYGVVLSRDGSAARFVLVFDDDPLGGQAIAHLGALESRMPALLREAGLPGAQAGFAGDTALARETIDRMLGSMVPVGFAIAVVVFVSLALLLRSLVAPLYLLVASVLAAAAPLGVTVYLFQRGLGFPYLGYYAPLGAGVLLVALGSDYNLFIVGRVWEEARSRPLHEAIAVAVPRATGAISTAAVTLAASFALLAIVPLVSFRQFAVAMVVGVIVDAFVVRSYLAPALMSVFGRLSLWPRRVPARDGRHAAPAGGQAEPTESAVPGLRGP